MSRSDHTPRKMKNWTDHWMKGDDDKEAETQTDRQPDRDEHSETQTLNFVGTKLV